MLQKFICPYCYEKHELDKCNVSCSYNLLGSGNKCIHGSARKDDNGFVFQNYKKICFQCTAATKYIHCPNMSSEEKELGIIPNNFLQFDSFSIALAGAKESGKSNYIAVMVNEIRRKMSDKFDCSINISADPHTEQEYINKYYDPLFKGGRVVDATDASANRPLIFPIDFKSGKSLALTFYDTAGENLDRNITMETQNRYFANANGIVLLVDPLQVPSIRNELKGKTELPSQNSDAVLILDRIIKLIRGRRSLNVQNKKIDIPLAVVISKIDVLEKFNMLSDAEFLTHESRHLECKSFIESDFKAVDNKLRQYFTRFNSESDEFEHEIMSKIDCFKNAAFFGVSSLGSIPEGALIPTNKICPRRVLDPLLWFLAQKNYIKTTR